MVDVQDTRNYLRERFGICSESQLNEAIKQMKKIDIGIFVGKDGVHGSETKGRKGERRADDREKAV